MIKPELSIKGSQHPEYLLELENWIKYRFIMDSGDEFIDEYLQRFSTRESNEDFEIRKKNSTSCAFAKGSIIDVKNAIYQRMHDISRMDGSDDYQKVINGENGGVDRMGSSMNHFIGSVVLPELLFIGKVGVYVDMPKLDGFRTISDTDWATPYLYTFTAENILNWEINYQEHTKEFTKLLLRESYYKTNDLGFASELSYRYRVLIKVDGGIMVKLYNNDNEQIDLNNEKSDEEYFLNLKRIPFSLFELDSPLTKDIANHQIALMNLESSDISYAQKANYPFLVKEQDKLKGSHLKNANADESESTLEVGATVGMAYPKGANPPGFIHPSPEPLQASMEKQKNLKDDIRTLINLALSNVKSKYTSAESKEMDERGLESGLSAIGLILENGERQIASIFEEYIPTTNKAVIAYPTRYSLKTDTQKLTESEKLLEQRSQIPSKKFQKIISKKIATTLIGMDISTEEMNEILSEIDAADYVTSDSDTISTDIENGILSLITAAKARGYNEDEPTKAAADHAAKVERIKAAQQADDSGARGNNDFKVNNDAGKNEKKMSQDPNLKEQ